MRWLVIAVPSILAGLMIFATEPTPRIKIDQVAWLQGCWESTAEGRSIEEQWMAPRAGTMLGMGRTVRDGRLVEYEQVLIRQTDAGLAYEAHPSGQPTATFVAATASETAVVFDNPEHDFPQHVGYRPDGPNKLVAWISGVVKGKERRIEFNYQRARCAGE